jgi:bifunctional UDP-N-acetylglucosamine pyrophosphorylase/glucosamine-1-phosphate N-acetyltransferase/UDP-N-acetylglucosamine pyrophosphorylase
MGCFDNLAFIVLAAGLGTRMKSDKAKVLHEVNGKAMIIYIMETVKKIAGNNVIVVIGYQADRVKKTISGKFDVLFAKQEIPKGTGHAVLKAIPFIAENIKNLVILCGDVPLVQIRTLETLIEKHTHDNNHLTIQAVDMANPFGYGRIIFDKNHQVLKIVEESDADENEKKITTINTGIYCCEKNFLVDAVKKIKAKNVKNEYYFTDIVDIGCRQNKKIGAVIADEPGEFIGINSSEELKKAEEMLLKYNNKIP